MTLLVGRDILCQITCPQSQSKETGPLSLLVQMLSAQLCYSMKQQNEFMTKRRGPAHRNIAFNQLPPCQNFLGKSLLECSKSIRDTEAIVKQCGAQSPCLVFLCLKKEHFIKIQPITQMKNTISIMSIIKHSLS